MKISAKEQYGLRAIAELAGRFGQGPVPVGTVATAQGISEHYLEQVLPVLRDAGLVHSTRGAHGGYMLARQPDQISVGEVLRALDGEILPIRCVSEEDALPCDRGGVCAARTVWEAISARVLDALEGMTLADL
jgi:Rrf2 family cysteine metabolism transcriptional repressor